MLKTQKALFFWLWFPVVSSCIYLGILLSQPLGKFLFKLTGTTYSVSNDGFFEDSLSLLLLVGLFMGFGQWIVINTRIKQTHGWILATLIGFSIGSFVSFGFFALLSGIADEYSIIYEWIWMVGTGAGAGMCTGFCQWVSLKGETTDSRKWSLVMALSLAIGTASLLLLVGIIPREAIAMPFSIIVGLISGVFAEPLLIQSEI